MFRLLLVSRRSVKSRPLPALYQHLSQYRQFRISRPGFSSISSIRIQPTSKDSVHSSDASTATGHLSGSISGREADLTTAQDAHKDPKDAPTSQSPNGEPRPKRAYVRRKPLLPRPPKIKPPQPPGPRAHYKKWRKSTPEERQEATLKKLQVKAEKLRIAAENRAQKEVMKEEKRRYWRDKRVQKAQQELEERARKLEARQTMQQEAEERKEAIRMKKEAKLAAIDATEERKKQSALFAIERAALEDKKRTERKAKRVEREAMEAKQAARLSSIRSEVYPEGAANYLEWAHASAKRPGAKADKRRINLTSQSLANDVLERLKPSLDKHKGCDIVDINPGVGIWSATLHDYLKPRKHILLEPDEGLYAPLLKPLLDAPDSKYTLIPKSGIVWRHLEDVLTKSHLPGQEAYEGGDPRLEQPNNTLLVVASLGFFPRRPYRGFPSISQLVLHQLIESVRSHSLFQRYGLVRMLVWIGDTEALKVLPKVIGHRRKSSIEAEIACEIKEIASCTSYSANKDSMFATSNALEVLERMAKAELSVTPERESDVMQEIKREIPDAMRSKQFSKPFLSKLEALERGYKNGEFKEFIDSQPSAVEDGKGRSNSLRWTPEYSLLQLYRRQYQSGQTMSPTVQKLVDEHFEIMGLQRMKLLSSDDTQRERLSEEITSREQILKDQLEDCSPTTLEKLISLIDNAQAVALVPPLLVWDRREAEPLKVHPEEFFPEQEMTLLDLQPQPLWSVLRQNYPENWETFEFIVSQLMMASRQPLKRGLESLAPGAFEWLVEHCPLLTDPTQGGSLDPGEIRIRMLTTDMLKQMIEAWMEWPFRPTRYELIARSGSAVFDPAGMEDENTF